MIDVLRIAHLRIAPQEGNLEVGNCEGNLFINRDGLILMLVSNSHFAQKKCQTLPCSTCTYILLQIANRRSLYTENWLRIQEC